MAIKLVRQPSETPNINNIDDIVGLRYAYGNQNGFVIKKGSEISHTINGSTFTINSGRLVLQGVEVDIDANGLALTVDNLATKLYFSVYLTVNLALNTVSIQYTYDTAGYPEIDPGDDLTQNSSGTARLEIYRFTTQNGIISDATKVAKPIEYTAERTVAKALDSVKINGLQLHRDENGILKIGDIVVPQRKVISSATIPIAVPATVLFDMSAVQNKLDKKYELIVGYDGEDALGNPIRNRYIVTHKGSNSTTFISGNSTDLLYIQTILDTNGFVIYIRNYSNGTLTNRTGYNLYQITEIIE